MPLESLPVTKIIVSERVRKDVGNVLGLAESIGRLGLLHPVVVNSRCELIAGTRRLAAVKKLGWKEVPCHVVGTLDDAVAALQAERDENTCREPLAPTELVEIGRKIEALERPLAAERKNANLKIGDESPSRKFSGSGSDGETRDKVGDALGVSGRTYEKARLVVELAEREPEEFGDLPAKMDAVSVDAAYREIKERRFGPPPPPHHDPEHPYAKLLQQIVNLASAISAACNDESDDSKLRQYLLNMSFVFPRAKIVNGRHYGWKCVGLRGLYRAVQLAGLPGKAKNKDQLLKAVAEAMDPDGDKE